MADDPFEDLLELEDDFYREGYEAGVADSTYTGMIEGKVFGVEKGYEKALELAKMRGRAMVWDVRASGHTKSKVTDSPNAERFAIGPLDEMQSHLASLVVNSRLTKHIETLLTITDTAALKTDNSDESVSELDDRLSKARTKAKVIATLVKEPLSPAANTSSGIEDSTGLSARH